MKRFSLVLVGATLALSTVLVAIPAMAATSTVSWDFSGGFPLTPGAETDIANLNLPDPAGSQCTAEVDTTNGRSIHPGNDLNVYLNGDLLLSLPGFEDEPFEVNSDSAAFVSLGGDALVVSIASTRSRVTSSAGTLTVTCEEPPGGGEGCTPGYWKQEHHFDSWEPTGFEPGDSFDAVFGVDGNIDTLLDGLKAKGGGENALARHAVAALLNSLNPDVSYEFTALEVIALVQDAYGAGEFEAAKDLLAEQNETGCPLN